MARPRLGCVANPFSAGILCVKPPKLTGASVQGLDRGVRLRIFSIAPMSIRTVTPCVQLRTQDSIIYGTFMPVVKDAISKGTIRLSQKSPTSSSIKHANRSYKTRKRGESVAQTLTTMSLYEVFSRIAASMPPHRRQIQQCLRVQN
jgi:hypothetical protein